LGCALSVVPLALRAEEHPAPQPPSAQGHSSDTPKAEGGAHAQPHGQGQIHGTSPAEGHAPAHGEGHHGPEVKLFGAAGGPAVNDLQQFGLKVLNFAIFAAIIVFAVKGKASAAFRERAEELRAALSQAEKDRAEGEAQILALEAKMAGLQGELDGILSKADADAQAEKARIIEAARSEAEAILAQAQAEIGHHHRQAEKELRALVTQLAVEGATQRLQAAMQTSESSKVMDRAIQQVGGAK
jgi:F-type H+-transporting ATPase subunit b